jgi:hypothetical protein
MQNLIFKSPVHEENFETAWVRIDEKNRTEKNRAIVYLLAWIETMRPGTINLLLNYETMEVSHWHYCDKWQTRMTQNAIFLIHNFELNDFDYNLGIVDASRWNKCFVQAFCIYYNTSYFEMKARWNELLELDADGKTVTIVSISSH